MFRGFFKRIFKLLLQIQQENGFYLPVNTDLPAKFNTVNPLLSPLGGLFISSPFEGGGGGAGAGAY